LKKFKLNYSILFQPFTKYQKNNKINLAKIINKQHLANYFKMWRFSL